MNPFKILVAAPSTSALRSLRSSSEEFELLHCTSLTQAEHEIRVDGIKLFVVDVHFDESRVMELLKSVRENKQHTSTPVIIMRNAPSEHARMLRETFEVMKIVHAVSDYVEFDGSPERFELHLRQAIEAQRDQAHANMQE